MVLVKLNKIETLFSVKPTVGGRYRHRSGVSYHGFFKHPNSQTTILYVNAYQLN